MIQTYCEEILVMNSQQSTVIRKRKSENHETSGGDWLGNALTSDDVEDGTSDACPHLSASC